jgi:hypothetical protein
VTEPGDEPPPVKIGQTRVDDDGDIHRVVGVNAKWAWVRIVHQVNRTLHGRPRRARKHHVAAWRLET